ncbi:hypothetical protein THAOC_00801 [Thalassiosira oceanica]|uniref:Reverse transcriptase Ty1/copia-type domain-containing protein n=1 Tax=Thalassiosira oceanica TaxID=159749 RepID=K0TR88_THAOC|nr:hypothetical protein THAOC_00801 [Thalassiosira oceanica]|eukprot:EJK77372.1 hypothetical protein THAOC_00801 [Thalassiosira oceanica]
MTDILVISDNAESVLRNELGSGFEKFGLKEESIGPPAQYLGGKLSLVETSNNTKAWQFSSSQYVQEAVHNVEKYLAELRQTGFYRASVSLLCRPTIVPRLTQSGHKPGAREVDEADAAFYHSLIGMLRWIVELGRVDICIEVSLLLSHHLVLPRRGHFDQALHIFGYLRAHHNAAMVFDPAEWNVPATDFQKQDWNYSVYGCDGLTEELPDDMSKPLGKSRANDWWICSTNCEEASSEALPEGSLTY